MAEIITRRVPVGISACVYECPVRYNGKAFDALSVLGREKGDFSFTPVCPECMAGLGVPRSPIHLTGEGEAAIAGEAKVRDRSGTDVTADLVAGARACLAALDRAGAVAFIAREASPTCGLYKARVGKRRTEHAGGSGVFGAMLLARPDLFVIPDEGLVNALLWWDWRRRLHAWLWLRDRDLANARDLYDAWHVIKFVVQETNRPQADEIGRSIAALPKNPSPVRLERARSEMLSALRAPSTRARIRQAAWKTFAHHRKKGALEGVDLHGLDMARPEEPASMEEIARQLITLERVSFENDLLFATSPVIRRDRDRVRRQRELKAPPADPT